MANLIGNHHNQPLDGHRHESGRTSGDGHLSLSSIIRYGGQILNGPSMLLDSLNSVQTHMQYTEQFGYFQMRLGTINRVLAQHDKTGMIADMLDYTFCRLNHIPRYVLFAAAIPEGGYMWKQSGVQTERMLRDRLYLVQGELMTGVTRGQAEPHYDDMPTENIPEFLAEGSRPIAMLQKIPLNDRFEVIQSAHILARDLIIPIDTFEHTAVLLEEATTTASIALFNASINQP